MGEPSSSPRMSPRVSLIVVNYNGAQWLKPCLGSLTGLAYPSSRYEVLVVDNGSTDGSAELVAREFPRVRWIEHAVNNYCRALNVGVGLAVGEPPDLEFALVDFQLFADLAR